MAAVAVQPTEAVCMAAAGFRISPLTARPRIFLFCYLLLSPLSVAGNSGENLCDKQTPVNCMMHFAAFVKLPDDEKILECLNASRGLECMENILSRCTHVADVDGDYYVKFRRYVYQARLEMQETCVAVSFLRDPSWSVLWTMLCAAMIAETV